MALVTAQDGVRTDNSPEGSSSSPNFKLKARSFSWEAWVLSVLSFLRKSKHKEIVECLAEWESRSDNKKERLLKFPQGYAWRNKYALFGPDDSAVLIFNPEFVGRGKQKEALPTDAAAPAAAQALDEAQVVSHEGRVFEDLLKIHLEGGHWGTARQRHSASM